MVNYSIILKPFTHDKFMKRNTKKNPQAKQKKKERKTQGHQTVACCYSTRQTNPHLKYII